MISREFGNGSIHEENWDDMAKFLAAEGDNMGTVLEIGCGLSTILFDELGMEVTSLETSQAWEEKVGEELSARSRIVHYKYPEFPQDSTYYDIAFVDGPAYTNDARKQSFLYALDHSSFVFIHDSSRKAERAALTDVVDTSIWHETPYRDGLSLFMRLEGR